MPMSKTSLPRNPDTVLYLIFELQGFYRHSMRSMCTASSIPAEKAGLKLLVTAGPHARKMVGIWLFGSAAWVFSMVILGGITRLTRSGLSMTDWKFTGNLPPMSEDEWALEFEKYKQSPEYKRLVFTLLVILWH